MTWIIFAMLASLSWAIVQLVDKALISSEAPSTHHYWAMTGFATIAPVALMPIVAPAYVVRPDPKTALLVILAGACYFIANAFFFRALLSIDASITSAALAGIPGLTAIGSWLILNERIGLLPLAGLVSITLGVVVMSRTPRHAATQSPISLRALASLAVSEIIFVAEYLIEGAAAKHLHPISVFYWTRIGVLLCVAVLTTARPKLVRSAFNWAFLKSKKIGILTIANECLDMTAIACLIASYRSGPVGLATAVAYTQAAFVFVFTLLLNAIRSGTIPTQDDRPGSIRVRVAGLILVLTGVLLSAQPTVVNADTTHSASVTSHSKDAKPIAENAPPVGAFDTIQKITVIVSMLVLIWQVRELKAQIARSDMQSIYNRYLELTKIEIADATFHKMFLYGSDFERFSKLTTQELHERALSLLIFDQFSFLFNLRSRPLWSRPLRLIGNKLPGVRNWQIYQNFLDSHRTIWEINADYVSGVLTNPLLIRSWRDWGLGETWRGSQFYDFVNRTISEWRTRAGSETSRTTFPSYVAVNDGYELEPNLMTSTNPTWMADSLARDGVVGPFVKFADSETLGLIREFFLDILRQRMVQPLYGRYALRDWHLVNEGLLRLLTAPEISEALSNTTSADSLILWRSKLFEKLPGDGAVDWHQDYGYFDGEEIGGHRPSLYPMGNKSPWCWTVWIPLTDVTLKSGVMEFVVGSNNRRYATKMVPLSQSGAFGYLDPVRRIHSKDELVRLARTNSLILDIDTHDVFSDIDVESTSMEALQYRLKVFLDQRLAVVTEHFEVDDSCVKAYPMDAGEFLIFDQRAMHRSRPADSDASIRLAISARYTLGTTLVYPQKKMSDSFDGSNLDIRQHKCVRLYGSAFNPENAYLDLAQRV